MWRARRDVIVTRARAVVIGAGIGGLAVAAGLCSAGWDVTACERAASLEPIGAGLALAPNGLRALDAIGAGDALRALAVPQELGIRRSDGRWLIRSATGQMIPDRFGDTADRQVRAGSCAPHPRPQLRLAAARSGPPRQRRLTPA